jgi:hypothetical protein
MTTLSPELKAMVDIETALKDLSEDERSRVMQWASARFSLAPAGSAVVAKSASPVVSSSTDKYSTLAELYDAASPTTDPNRTLVVAYWFQYLQGSADVESHTINTELKHLGHGVGNITRAFSALKSHKPALVIQTRKEGTSQQARKRYKVTGEGRKAVEKMLTGGGE